MKRSESSVEDVLCRVQVPVFGVATRRTRVFAQPQRFAGFETAPVALFRVITLFIDIRSASKALSSEVKSLYSI
jgi:hypothetical protein